MLPNVIVILPENSLFIAVNLSRLSTDNSYIRQCNLRNHFFQQIQVPDLDITPSIIMKTLVICLYVVFYLSFVNLKLLSH